MALCARSLGAMLACAALVSACGDTERQSGGSGGSSGSGGSTNSGGSSPGGSANSGGSSSGGSSSGGATNSGGAEPDATGYAIVGEDLYPPLLQRVLAVDCPPSVLAECVSDSDCGAGKACVCGALTGFTGSNRCVPAECQTGAECVDAFCLLSLGGTDDGCCTYGNEGLFCGRSGSTCLSGGDCPGNGQACIYRASNDRFECQLLSCKCGG